ncbi:MAG: 23S rRNA (adenine(2503)-C(2))-methyltransferase RlmN [Pirellulales bacterium]|nr:23S rRNA (adenine(2503)-C(2))-methyltransferase RlmN [Pirellulales bacterium]
MLNALDETLSTWSADRSLPRFRVQQVRNWLFKRRAANWEQMTDLSKSLRADLAGAMRLWTTEIIHHTRAEDGTEKLLLRLADGKQIECVLLRDRVRRTICISTQVGCGMGCVFCASGIDGVERNLTTGEIVEQMLRLQMLLQNDERLSHVVVMGMGEPLANLDALLPALAEAHRPDGLDISARRITISTVGLPSAIDRLTRNDASYRLAISLHAPNDELRNELVPVNDKIGLDAILASADRYFDASGRRMTFEYVLLAGINDEPHHARQLIRLLAGREALLNVIPYNPVAELPYQTPSYPRQVQFRKILEEGGLRVRFRHRKGDRINAACGQLRRSQQPIVELG